MTVVGSEIDMAYFEKVKPWKVKNETVKVTKNKLGLSSAELKVQLC